MTFISACRVGRNSVGARSHRLRRKTQGTSLEFRITTIITGVVHSSLFLLSFSSVSRCFLCVLLNVAPLYGSFFLNGAPVWLAAGGRRSTRCQKTNRREEERQQEASKGKRRTHTHTQLKQTTATSKANKQTQVTPYSRLT